MREMKKKNIKSFVVHTTNDSAPIIWILGFDPGHTFTLLGRDPIKHATKALTDSPCKLNDSDLQGLISLDADVFGVRRESWIRGLMQQPSTSFYGLREKTGLKASICLRSGRAGAFCLDAANARDFQDLKTLVQEVVASHPDKRVECFALDNSPMDQLLREQGFTIPDFFKAIGPLTEWRKGKTGDIGRTPLVQCLSWF